MTPTRRVSTPRHVRTIELILLFVSILLAVLVCAHRLARERNPISRRVGSRFSSAIKKQYYTLFIDVPRPVGFSIRLFYVFVEATKHAQQT